MCASNDSHFDDKGPATFFNNYGFIFWNRAGRTGRIELLDPNERIRTLEGSDKSGQKKYANEPIHIDLPSQFC